MVSMSSLLKFQGRPCRKPLYGLVVLLVHTKALLVAKCLKPAMMPLTRPLPAPVMVISIKMPQKTPKAVNALRSLFCLIAENISCHLSLSNTLALFEYYNSYRSEEHTSARQSRPHLVSRLLLEK